MIPRDAAHGNKKRKRWQKLASDKAGGEFLYVS